MRNKKTQHFDGLEQLSTQELETILQNDWEQSETDNSEMIYRVLGILEQRKFDTQQKANTSAAWQEFQTRYNTPEGQDLSLYPCELPKQRGKSKSSGMLRRICAAAAVLCLVFILAVPAFGSESVFQIIGRWTEDFFRFSDGSPDFGETVGGSNNSYSGNNSVLMEVFQATVRQGCSTRVVPSWIPEGFQKDFLSETATPQYARITSAFVKDGKSLALTYRVYDAPVDSDFFYEKGAEDVKTMEIAGVTHYFYQNMGQQKCCWVNENVECSIAGDISRDDLVKIIRSIYA